MDKTISTQQTAANVAAVLDLLANTPIRLENSSQQLADQQLRHPLGQGERSLTEILAHLINCEARSAEAIYLALLADEPVLVDIHPERQLGKLLRYDQLAFGDLLAYFKFRRIVLLRVLASLKETGWSKAIRQEGKQRKETVYWLARSLVLHELEHLSDLETKLSPVKSDQRRSKSR